MRPNRPCAVSPGLFREPLPARSGVAPPLRATWQPFCLPLSSQGEGPGGEGSSRSSMPAFAAALAISASAVTPVSTMAASAVSPISAAIAPVVTPAPAPVLLASTAAMFGLPMAGAFMLRFFAFGGMGWLRDAHRRRGDWGRVSRPRGCRHTRGRRGHIDRRGRGRCRGGAGRRCSRDVWHDSDVAAHDGLSGCRRRDVRAERAVAELLADHEAAKAARHQHHLHGASPGPTPKQQRPSTHTRHTHSGTPSLSPPRRSIHVASTWTGARSCPDMTAQAMPARPGCGQNMRANGCR